LRKQKNRIAQRRVAGYPRGMATSSEGPKRITAGTVTPHPPKTFEIHE
jgi:hypothetical protein